MIRFALFVLFILILSIVLAILVGRAQERGKWDTAICQVEHESQLFMCDLRAGISVRFADEGVLPVWSPDGMKVAFTVQQATDLDIQLFDLETFTTSPVTSGGHSLFPYWSNSGEIIYYSDMDMKVYIINIDGSNNRPLNIPYVEDYQDFPALSPALTHLARNIEGGMIMQDNATQKLTLVERCPGVNFRWSPSGKKFAYLSCGAFKILDVETGIVTNTGITVPDLVEWSADEKTLAFHTASSWFLLDVQTLAVTPLNVHEILYFRPS